MANHKRTQANRFGVRAENFAAWYLMFKGYRILAKRWRNAGGEIDVLALHKDTLVAVEVKARAGKDALDYSVTPDKQRRMARAAEGIFLSQNKFAGLKADRVHNIRFDVVYITPRTWPTHIKDAWRL